MGEGVKEYDLHIESKSYKLKLLGKLVVQQIIYSFVLMIPSNLPVIPF